MGVAAHETGVAACERGGRGHRRVVVVHGVELVDDLGRELAQLRRQVGKLLVPHVEIAAQPARTHARIQRHSRRIHDPGDGVDLGHRDLGKPRRRRDRARSGIDELARHVVQESDARARADADHADAQVADPDIDDLCDFRDGLAPLVDKRGGLAPAQGFPRDGEVEVVDAGQRVVDLGQVGRDLAVGLGPQTLDLLSQAGDLVAERLEIRQRRRAQHRRAGVDGKLGQAREHAAELRGQGGVVVRAAQQRLDPVVQRRLHLVGLRLR